MQTWTPDGTETVATLRAKLTDAGLTAGHWADVPSEARRAFPKGKEAAAGAVPGIVASMAVKGMIDSYGALRASGMNALARQVAKAPILLMAGVNPDGSPNGNNQMGTTGTPAAAFGVPQWLTVNVNATPSMNVPIADSKAGSPWIVRDMLQAVKAGQVSKAQGEQAVQDAAAIHEFGHVLDNLTGSHLTSELMESVERETGADKLHEQRRAYSDTMRAWLIPNLSGYAASSPPESTAEAFSLTASGKPLPPLLKAWGERAIRAARTGLWFDA